MRTCEVVKDGVKCGKPYKARGMCSLHYQKWKKYGDPLTVVLFKKICTEDGCEDYRVGGGLCAKHYQRWRKHGDPSITKLNRDNDGMCSEPKCQNPYHAKGFCDMHYQRWVKHGDSSVSLADQSNRGTDNIGYTAAHIRIYQVRGKASQHQCVDCGDQAGQWSYDHTDPNEKVQLIRDMWMPYSTNLDFYEPRCVPCHKNFDLVQSNQPVTQEVTQ